MTVLPSGPVRRPPTSRITPRMTFKILQNTQKEYSLLDGLPNSLELLAHPTEARFPGPNLGLGLSVIRYAGYACWSRYVTHMLCRCTKTKEEKQAPLSSVCRGRPQASTEHDLASGDCFVCLVCDEHPVRSLSRLLSQLDMQGGYLWNRSNSPQYVAHIVCKERAYRQHKYSNTRVS